MILHIAMNPVRHALAERQVRGADIGLPLVESVGAIHGLSASRITWHAHRRFELLFVLEGATVYEFAGGRTVELAGGHVLVVPPGLPHRGLRDVRMPAALVGIVFDPRRAAARRTTPFTARDLAWLARRFDAREPSVRRMGADLRRLASSLARQAAAFAGGETADRAVAAAALRLAACAAILEAARQPEAPRTAHPQRAVEAAMAHMRAHFHEALPMAELARRAGCGRARLFQVFKAETGMTPNDCLQRLRVEKAQAWLADPSRTVTRIAFDAGFASSQYFSHVFRKYTGMTPTAFRRRAER